MGIRVRLPASATPVERRMWAYYRKAVRRGIELLDKARPAWFREIYVPELNLGSTQYCMLGQLYDDYTEGAERLSEVLTGLRERFAKVGKNSAIWGLDSACLDPEWYGFEALSASRTGYGEEWNRNHGYSILTEVWTAEILSRRAAERASEERV
jgi:hypothetical protein